MSCGEARLEEAATRGKEMGRGRKTIWGGRGADVVVAGGRKPEGKKTE